MKELDAKRAQEAALQQTRQGLETTLATLKDQGGNTKAVSSQIKTLNDQIGKTRVLRRGAGYMIGVLLCQCGSEVYAAMSGAETDGFKAAVQSLGWKLAGPVTPPLQNANGPLSPTQEDRLLNLHKALPGKNNNRFGVCAAPKLIQAMQKAGHKPYLMTEQFYSPTDPQKSVRVRYRKNGRTVKHQFRDGDTVPSCRTCQSALPCLLCGARPCP